MPSADDRGCDVVGEHSAEDHVVVFGFRGVGRRVVRQLATAGQRVVVVDPEIDATEQEDPLRWGVGYLAGYGHSQDTLHAARVSQARAVICVTEDDVRNIRLAMLVRDASPTVRLVVRVANSSVGSAMEGVVAPGSVLDVAALASASFVEVAVGRTTHEVDLGGTCFSITTVPSRAPGRVGELWPTLMPVAVRPSSGGPLVSNPPPGTEVAAGDLVTVMGTSEAVRAAGLGSTPDAAIASARPLRRRVREAFGAMADAVDRPFRIAFAVLVALATISVTILLVGYQEEDGTRMDVLDAIYFTAETIATVGFGDYDFRSQDVWLRVWAIFLILLGATLITLTTALLTNALVTRRLAQSLGRQRVTGMSDHIVVIGLGSVGSKVATDLRSEGYEVAVIDGGDGERFLPTMRAAGIPVLFGDATLPETQAAAGIHRARGVAVLTSDDLVNIETGLAVRGVVGDRPVPIAVRVFSRNLARLMGRGLDAGIARSIAELASPWFVGAALGVDVLGTFYVGSDLFVAARVPQSVALPTTTAAVLRTDDATYVIGQYQDLLTLL